MAHAVRPRRGRARGACRARRRPRQGPPAAGGETTLTAAVDAIVAARPWPYPGQAVAQGDAALQLVPRVAGDRSLAQLEAEVARARRRGGGRPRARRPARGASWPSRRRAGPRRTARRRPPTVSPPGSMRPGATSTPPPRPARGAPSPRPSRARALRRPRRRGERHAGPVGRGGNGRSRASCARGPSGSPSRFLPARPDGSGKPRASSCAGPAPSRSRCRGRRCGSSPAPPSSTPGRPPSPSCWRWTATPRCCRSGAPSRPRSLTGGKARPARSFPPRRSWTTTASVVVYEQTGGESFVRREVRRRGPCGERRRSPGAPRGGPRGHARGGGDPPRLSSLLGRARGARSLRRAACSTPSSASRSATAPPSSASAAVLLVVGAVVAARHAGRRLPRPHRADGHGRHGGPRHGAGGGRGPRRLPRRVRAQRRAGRPAHPLGLGPRHRGRVGRVRVGRGRLPRPPGRGGAAAGASPCPAASSRPAIGPISSIMGEITFLALTVRHGRARSSCGASARPSCAAPSSPSPASRRWCRSAATCASSAVGARPRRARPGPARRRRRRRGARGGERDAGRRLPRGRRPGVPRPRARPRPLRERPRGHGAPRRGRDPPEALARSRPSASGRAPRGAPPPTGPGPRSSSPSRSSPGANTLELTRRIDARARGPRRRRSPRGSSIEKENFRQADFIDVAIRNVSVALRDGAILVARRPLPLPGERAGDAHLGGRASRSPSSSGVLILSLFGATLNTMTLGGFTIAIGALVDDAIIDVENVFRRLRQERGEARRRAPGARSRWSSAPRPRCGARSSSRRW